MHRDAYCVLQILVTVHEPDLDFDAFGLRGRVFVKVRSCMMKSIQVLITAMLVIVGAAAFVIFATNRSEGDQMTHREQIVRRRSVAVAERRDAVAQLAALDPRQSARKSRCYRFLDLHMYQLVAHFSLCQCLGREI